MKNRYLFLLKFILVASDIALINIAFFLSYHLTNKYLIDIHPAIYQENVWGCTVIWLISTFVFKLYTNGTLRDFPTLHKATLASLALYAVALIPFAIYNNPLKTFPVEFFAMLLPILGMAFVMSRFTAVAIEELVPQQDESVGEEKFEGLKLVK